MRTAGLRVRVLLCSGAALALLGIAPAAPRAIQSAKAAEPGRAQATSQDAAQRDADLIDLQAVSRAFKTVAKIARPGVVNIRVSGGEREGEVSQREERLRERLREVLPEDQIEHWLRRLPQGVGSGFIIDADGYILTNNHVVAKREEITVVLDDERKFKATIVGTDPKSDLAVIKIDAPNLQPLKLGDSDRLEVGDWVIAIGAPFNLSQTVTHGIVSAKGRTGVAGLDLDYQDFIQTDAAINPGNSGGPLLNLRGEVVGVNTAIATQGEAVNAGIAFTIPSNMALKIAQQLKAKGTVERGWLGISYSPIQEEDVELFGLRTAKGVLVERVLKDSPAESAGVEIEDVLIEVDGAELASSEQLRQHVADLHPGDVARLRLLRNRQEVRLEIKLGLQPEDLRAARTAAGTDSRPVKRLGLRVRTLRAGALLTYSRDVRGVVVVAREGGAKDAPDVKPLEVIVGCNDKPVKTAQELIDAAQAVPADQPVRLEILEASGDRRIIKIKPREKE
jgi:serine protease Do